MTEKAVTPAIDFLRERLTRAPNVALILGSGLGALADEVQDAVRIPYGDIPGFPESTVVGHSGAIVAGILEGVEVAVLQGRFHLYEGHEPGAVAMPLRVLSALGVEQLVVTNAAGGINPSFKPGDLMVIADHINLMFRNPLIGRVVTGEERFPDMSDPYNADLRRAIMDKANEFGIALSQGVYAGVLGPSYETPAEIRMLGRLGADAVGMSTVPEVVVAKALGLKVLGVSCITNLASGLGQSHLSHEEVLEVGREAGKRLARLLRGVLPEIADLNLTTEAAG